MSEIEVWNWWLPPEKWNKRGKERLSRWKMSAAEAAQRGALRPEPSTREVRRNDGGSTCGMANVGSSWSGKPTE